MIIDETTPAIVTGGASGLGRATAEMLAAKGAKVALFDLNEELGEALAAEIGGVFCKVDVTDEAQVDAGFAKARAAHGQERILVNCAGMGDARRPPSRAARPARSGISRSTASGASSTSIWWAISCASPRLRPGC